jgi:hypothetical protein
VVSGWKYRNDARRRAAAYQLKLIAQSNCCSSILASLHMQTADDLFGTPQGSPRTDKLIDASIQWAERIMRRIDEVLR